MNNEAYGIEFKAVTDKFKARMKELANDVRNFGKEAKKEATITPEIITSGYKKQIEYVKDQMDTINDQIKRIKFGGKMGNLSGLEADYEKLAKINIDNNRKIDLLNCEKMEMKTKIQSKNTLPSI